MKTLAWIIIIILVGYGIYWLVNRPVNIDTVTITPAEPKTVTVIYSASGFGPATVTIKKGDTVTFANQSGTAMWVASAMHPSHAVYDGTSLDEHCAVGAALSFDSCKDIKNGTSYSFTFNKVGSWNYHNHSASNHFGKVVVE